MTNSLLVGPLIYPCIGLLVVSAADFTRVSHISMYWTSGGICRGFYSCLSVHCKANLCKYNENVILESMVITLTCLFFIKVIEVPTLATSPIIVIISWLLSINIIHNGSPCFELSFEVSFIFNADDRSMLPFIPSFTLEAFNVLELTSLGILLEQKTGVCVSVATSMLELARTQSSIPTLFLIICISVDYRNSFIPETSCHSMVTFTRVIKWCLLS